ncbi:hypothetical protein ONZ43_g5678 [Nemania bipapillata]|uniref:Uncharacterized protein n=1 Tax=Nemania bipapillata TaxID=110536 RepID=A0ACC2I7P6_9PEZI|nr:hypothetical protein ONZ43_g5678 [Nemania bipapillata]
MSAISITFYVVNPSPLEISFGTCSFNIEDHEGRLLAELKGRLDIRCHYFETTFQGNLSRVVTVKLATTMKEAAAVAEATAIAAATASLNADNSEPSGHKVPGARLVGRRCAGAGWCDETIKDINVPIKNVGKLFQALGIEDVVDEPEDKKRTVTKWTHRLLMR